MMTPQNSQQSREDVLDAFAVEQDAGRQTLERYLREYPEYANELIDLSRELSGAIVDDNEPLSAKDTAMIDAAWRRHIEAAPKVVSDPFAALSITQLRKIAESLDVPRQVITGFRERRVIIASVPQRFLKRFAAAAHTTLDLFVSAVAPQPAQNVARSYKSDNKPDDNTAVTFEQLLIDAGVPDEKRALLMDDD
jgi:hypothetical protein